MWQDNKGTSSQRILFMDGQGLWGRMRREKAPLKTAMRKITH
jgi:hypothetical protein